ncbi:MAG: FxsA family protein [Mariprofundus sp.]
MMRLLFLLFVLTPLLELYLLIEIGGQIGGLATIFLCLATAALGGFLVRLQGLQTLLSARVEMARGQVPAESAIHGLMLVASGIFLLTPGFFTDSVGFILLVPTFRRWLTARLFPHQPGRQTWIEAEIVRHDDNHLS